MKYLKIFEEFERGSYSPLSIKQLNIAKQHIYDKYPYLNEELLKRIKVSGSIYSYEEEYYDSIPEVLDSIYQYYSDLFESFEIYINNMEKKDGLLNHNNSIEISEADLDIIPFKFGEVLGDFDCSENNLTSLYGCPRYVGESFNCSYNQLKNLIGGPNHVSSFYDCTGNSLISLEGIAEYVGLDIDCGGNAELNIIDYLPKKFGYLYYSENDKPVDLSRLNKKMLKKVSKIDK